MKGIISKIYCWLFKHDFVKLGEVDNGRSKWGTYYCVRCGYKHDWQLDYSL